MIIKSITIENFQSYHGTQVIEFSKGLNLIVGKGGKGKSKLFNAFYWVLFGKIYITDVGWCTVDELPQSSRGAMHKYECVNKKALSMAAVGDMVPTAVKLDLEDDKGELYSIERSLTTVRKTGKDWDSKDAWQINDSIIRVSYDSTTGTVVKVGYQAEETVRTLFPNEMRNYIWFQGESLESLIDFQDKDTLKNAVKHISYYPYYEKLSAIISKSKAKIEKAETAEIRRLNAHNSQVNVCLGEIQNLKSKIAREQESRDKIQVDIDKVSQALVADEARLQGLASFTQLVKDYDRCEGEIKDLNNEIFGIDEYQRKKLPSLWILRKSDELIKKSKELIEKYAEEEFSTPEQKFIDNPGRSKLEEILRDHKCFVCGSDVSEGSAAFLHIMQRLEEQDAFFRAREEYLNNIEASKKFTYFMGKIQDYPDSLQHALKAIDRQWQDSEDRLEDLLAKRKKKNEEKAQLDKQIEDIKKKYGVDPVKQASTASAIGSSVSASRSSLESLKRKLDVSEKTIKKYYSDLKDEQDKLEDLGASTDATTRVAETEWKHISAFLEDICKRVQEQARIDLLHKIEARANEFYAVFTAHDNGYKGNVKIEDDYSIEFDAGLNTSHNDRKKMSIINALLSLNQEAMNVYYPFISDAPTSNFDIETTFKYLLGIKDIFDQTIIMTKDVEIGGDAYQQLLSESKVSRIYELSSEVYCAKSKKPDQHEVSTRINQLK